jgi:hypothetical protein
MTGYRFSSNNHGLTSTEELARSADLLLSKSYVQLESRWTPSRYVCCCYAMGYHAIVVVVVDVIHRCHSWVGLLVASLLWKLAWCLLVP